MRDHSTTKKQIPANCLKANNVLSMLRWTNLDIVFTKNMKIYEDARTIYHCYLPWLIRFQSFKSKLISTNRIMI